MTHPSDDELRAHLRNTENPSVERKSAGDIADVLPAAVAFANSLPVDAPGLIFFPVRNDGTIEVTNLDSLQQKASKYLARAYPPLPHTMRLFRSAECEVVAIIVWGSSERPHFSGAAFARHGSETIVASAQLFERMIAERTSIVYELSRRRGSQALVEHIYLREHAVRSGSVKATEQVTIEDVNQFWLTLRSQSGDIHSYSLSLVQLSFNHQSSLLVIAIYPQAA